MTIQHKSLAVGEWQKLSLAEQMGNIGSEISRAFKWQNKDKELYENAVDRALELLDLTISDSRWRARLKELSRVREIICDTFFGGKKYFDSFERLNNYFFHFAYLARITR